jgi:hypothetical protein
MIAIGLAMLQLNFFAHRLVVREFSVTITFLDIPVVIAGLFTAISGFGYVVDGLAQLQAKGHGDPKPWSDL